MDFGRLIFIIVPLVIGVAGIGIAGYSAARLVNEVAFGRRALSAEGTVVGFQRRRSRSITTNSPRVTHTEHPIVEYTTRDGQPARFESPLGMNLRLQREGDRIAIRYDPANPTNGRIAGGAQYGMLVFLIIFGLGMAMIALLVGVVMQSILT